MKTYKFIEDSWWDYPACDCCLPTESVYYTPVGFETNGTPHSVEDCYLVCIEIEDGPSAMYEFYCLTDYELKEICRTTYNFEIEIEYMQKEEG